LFHLKIRKSLASVDPSSWQWCIEEVLSYSFQDLLFQNFNLLRTYLSVNFLSVGTLITRGQLGVSSAFSLELKFIVGQPYIVPGTGSMFLYHFFYFFDVYCWHHLCNFFFLVPFFDIYAFVVIFCFNHFLRCDFLRGFFIIFCNLFLLKVCEHNAFKLLWMKIDCLALAILSIHSCTTLCLFFTRAQPRGESVRTYQLS